MKFLAVRISLAAVLASSLLLTYAGGQVDDIGRSIPKTVGAWKASAEDRSFDRSTLYDYMDGGAEVYLAFDLRRVLARKYAGSGAREIVLDVYDMGTSEEAFGVFSCDREDPPSDIGQGSTYAFGLLRFRQGRYFVTAMTTEEDEASERAVLDIGRAAAAALGPPGPLPGLLGVLPPDGLKPERTSFFHAEVNLNNRYFVSSENVFGLDRSTDCVFAEYASGTDRPGRLLVVRYPGPERAAAARRTFLAAYAPEAGPDGLARTESGTWVLALARDLHLIVVFEAPDPDWARRLAASVKLPAP